MARIIAADLGSHTVKLAIFEGSFGRFQLEDYQVQRVTQDETSAPTLLHRLEALEALQQGRRDPKDRPSWVAAFPAEMASFRVIRLPFADKAQVDRTLRFEVEGQVPFDLDDMVLVNRVLRTSDGQSDVLICLAARDRVQPLLEGLASIDAEPRDLLVDADALGSLAGSGVQVVIDLGHQRNLIAICRDGKVMSARATNGGGRDLTLALCQTLGLSFIDAEGLKHDTNLRGGVHEAQAEWDEEEHTNPTHEAIGAGAADPATILRAAFAPQMAALRATLIAFEDSLGIEIEGLVLTGGGCELRGLRDQLEVEFGVPARRAQVSDHAEALGDPGRFGLVHSMGAIAAAGNRGGRFDLRVGSFAYKGNLANLRLVATAGLVAAMAFATVGTGLFGWKTYQIKREIAEVEAKIVAAAQRALPDLPPEKVEDPTKALAALQEKTLELSLRVDALGAIIDPSPPTLSLLKDISQSMPPHADARIDVYEMSITPTNISMKAGTDGFENATRIEAALQRNANFKSARKGDEKKKVDGVQFTINIPLGEDADASSEEG